jgi:hypothetical protein
MEKLQNARNSEIDGAMSQPKNVLDLAGIALADLAVNVSMRRYFPTLHTSKTSRWRGTKILQVRFGTYPDKGLLEIAWAEALARAPTWDAWAFGCASIQGEDYALLVEAGGAPLTNIVRIVQKFRPPDQVFGLVFDPHFSLRTQDTYKPIDATQAVLWKGLLERGINRAKTARENWLGWSDAQSANS